MKENLEDKVKQYFRNMYLEKYRDEIYQKYCELHPEEIHSDWILEEDGNEEYIDEIITIVKNNYIEDFYEVIDDEHL